MLAWQNDARCQSRAVSNHYQRDGLAMATDKHSSVPEGFKEIPGYGGKYFINKEGEVWSISRKCLLRPRVDKGHPYPYLKPIKNGKATTTTVYYLMRITWMGPPPGKVGAGRGLWCVNHKDGNKLNSCLDNLEWVTCEENNRHAWETGLNRVFHGEESSSARLTSRQVQNIRLRCLEGEPVRKIANELKEGIELIKKIKYFVIWKHQDHDLIEPMMAICQSKFLRILKKSLDEGTRIKSFYKFKRRNC